MPSYQTLSEAISAMRERGFVNTFTIQHRQIYCPEQDATFAPEQLTLLEHYEVKAPQTLAGAREVFGFKTANNMLGLMTNAYAEYEPDEFAAILERCNYPSARRA
ncbi:hypothetical protein [Pontibacter vulgaris]|uniref:hypothetical protein n=1 Tax=Pontibacter vulgaris TaxID=2905679 RepID=UPI001FA76B83|nr:hypothetical protein [Pontibacter vulgaris]